MVRIRKRQSGFGFMEVIIALVLLSVLIYSVSSFITSSTSQSHRIAAGASCQSAAQSTIDALNAIGVRDNVLPFVFDGNDPRLANYLTNPVFQNFGPKLPSPAGYFSDLAFYGNGDLNLSHLILSNTEYLEELYNSNPAFCSGYQPVPNELVQAPSGMRIEIQILPINKAGETQACTTPRNARPVSAGPDFYPRTLGDPDLGFRANIKVTMSDNQECTASADYRHQLDSFMNSAIPQLSLSASGTLLPPNIFCPSGSSVTISLNFDPNNDGVLDFEPGSAPLCSEDGTAFSPCWTFSYGARQAGSTTNSTSGNRLQLTFNGMSAQASNYWLYTTVVDSAGNIGSLSGIPFRVNAACPPPPTTSTTTTSSSTTSTTSLTCSYSATLYCSGNDERSHETAPEPGCPTINDFLVLSNSPACTGGPTTTVTTTTVTSTSGTTSTSITTTTESTTTTTSSSTTTTESTTTTTTTTTSSTTTTTRYCYFGAGGTSSGEEPAGQCSDEGGSPGCSTLWCQVDTCPTAVCNESTIGDECMRYECTSAGTTTWYRGSNRCMCD